MTRFYESDLTVDRNSPFVRDASNKLVRRSYWMDMTDQVLVMVMTKGIGANLTNDEKRAHLIDLKRERLIDEVCTQEILTPERLQCLTSDTIEDVHVRLCDIYATKNLNSMRLSQIGPIWNKI